MASILPGNAKALKSATGLFRTSRQKYKWD